ncbi:MAG: AAA family ATPase [Chloroflexota bacterium]|nr:AAA family ATPase [Chloroflexota bacterium]
MTSNFLNDPILRAIDRDLDRLLPLSPTQTSSGSDRHHFPAAPSVGSFLSDLPTQSLSWLWPGRIPFGQLTLLDAASSCGSSLVALHLAACVSTGSHFPDGSSPIQSTVILIAPYDSPSDTLRPRLEAAGGDPSHVVLLRSVTRPSAKGTSSVQPFSLPRDLDCLTATITHHQARLVVIDPASAFPGLRSCLPALLQVAQQTNCAILLTRSPARSPRCLPPPSPLLPCHRCSTRLAVACSSPHIPLMSAPASSSPPNTPCAPNPTSSPTR